MTTTESDKKRKNRIFLARLSEQAERYDDMVAQMKELIEMDGDLSVDERNLLSLAYKSVISKLRVSWSNISAIEQKKESRGSQKHISTIHEYRRRIEDDMEKLCQEILRELDGILIPNASTGDSKVFYYKMKGDYCRYLAEFLSGGKLSSVVITAQDAYKTATDVARTELTPTHPLRLGLALNFSVFYYEILSSPDHACDLARQAFDDAINELDSLTEEFYVDSTLAMQRLRDNLSLWMSSDSDESEREAENFAEEATAET